MPQYHNIFDSHAHYTDAAFSEDRTQLLHALPEAGVSRVVLAASDLTDSARNLALAQEFSYIYAAAGIHPECEATAPTDYDTQLRALAAQEKLCAIGEIGLDYHYEGANRERQIALFRSQLTLAAELSLPIIVHCRDATADCLTVLREYRPRGVMHCFSGSAETAREVLSLGMYLSFTGVLTFKNAKKSLEALAVVPMDKLLVETDCPYMAPVPHRGTRCDSRMIPDTASVIAAEKGCSVQEVLNLTSENAGRLFGISV